MWDAGLRCVRGSVIGTKIGGYVDDALNGARPSSDIDYKVITI